MRYFVILVMVLACGCFKKIKTHNAEFLPPDDALPFCFVATYKKELTQFCTTFKKTCDRARKIAVEQGHWVGGISSISKCLKKVYGSRKIKRLHRLQCDDPPIIIIDGKRQPLERFPR